MGAGEPHERVTNRLFILRANVAVFVGIVVFLWAIVTENGEGLVPFALAWFLIAARVLLARVRAGPDGITVHNPIRRYELPWERIDRFDLDLVLPFMRVGAVYLVEGRRIRMWGLVRDAKAGDRDRATRYVDELNHLLSEHRPGSA